MDGSYEYLYCLGIGTDFCYYYIISAKFNDLSGAQVISQM